MDTPKPIGYWLMHLHNLLEEQFERTLAGLNARAGSEDEGPAKTGSVLSVSRRQWQLLNTLSRGSRTSGELAEALAPFWSGAAEDPQAVLADLADRGWTRLDGDAIGLSETGRELHAELAARVERARAALLGDLTPEQYHQTVRSLATMAANVEAALGNPARTASSVS